MAIPLYVPLFTFSSIVIDIFVIFTILRKREQANIAMNWYLIGMIASIIIWILSVYLQETIFPYYPDKDLDNLLGFAVLAAISNIVIVIGLLLISIFIKYLVEPELDFKQSSYLISLVVLISGFYILIIIGAFLENTEFVDITFNIANLANLTMVISVLYFSRNDITILQNSIVNASNQLKLQLKLLNIGLHTALVGIIPLLIIANFYSRDAIAISFILITISLSVIAYAYQLDPRVVYILPERTYQTIVVSNAGVLRYSKHFAGEEDETSTILISGALNAVSSMMSEFYDAPVYPNMIQFKERLILFKWSTDYFLAVFSDRDSKLIRSAMDATIKEIDLKYGDTISSHLDGGRLLDLDATIEKTFYFVYT